MKDWLSSEIGHDFESKFSFYRKKEDEKPAGTAKIAIGFRVPLSRFLLAVSTAVAVTALFCLAAKYDRRDGED